MDKQSTVSVIIPSYNKAKVLPATLRALEEQTIGQIAFEVVVVDDGSTDNTQEVVTSLCLSYPLRLVHQENKGAGAARNLGASLAKGGILLFLDSDIILEPEALLAHVKAHRESGRTIVLSRILPLMPNPIGLEDLLFQENFDSGPHERRLPWHCTITQCLSIKQAHFYQVGPFATDLPRGQDIEFGYRATQGDFEIRYCPQVRGWHNHAMGIKQRCRVERRNHRYLVAFFQRYPFLAAEMRYLRHKWPIDWQRDPPSLIARKMVRQSLAWRPALSTAELTWKALKQVRLPLPVLRALYWSIVGSHQILGLRDGIRMHGPISAGFREGGQVQPSEIS